MSAAHAALDELSRDPEAARLAREREDALKLHNIDLAHALNKGKLEGRDRIAHEKDPVVLERWLTRALTATDVAEIFPTP
ncbi:MAG: hypothetical protein KIT84_22310 [Labilithrix sp.]|nr:hypothetical protein [Labilithrix sp.]MCW5813779.1 hypothetical protein [Labilithrix sp.]